MNPRPRPSKTPRMTSPSTHARAPGRRRSPVPLRFIYGMYAAVLFLAVVVIALVGVILHAHVAPAPRHRPHRSKSVLPAGAGMPLRVRGCENLPRAANAWWSPITPAISTAWSWPPRCRPRFGFVIKREMNDVPVAGCCCGASALEFVERFNRHKGGTDARRVLRTAASGHSLVFFPEGTFTPEVGLGKFHTGAFAIAARAACPVVPAVILGTRRNMPATRASCRGRDSI